MKKIFLLILIIGCFSGQVIASGATAPMSVKNGVSKPVPAVTVPPVQPQPVDFGSCSKVFKINSEKLFYLTLAGVNANRFKIDEIQSKSGYVLFTVARRQFLASVITIDSQNSMLKITPCDNVYYFPIGIVQNMFKYIELNFSTPIEKLSIS